VFARAWDFLKVRKKFWLLPMLLVLAVFAVAVMLSVGSESNFVYTLN
jgi:competence protein ComGC